MTITEMLSQSGLLAVLGVGMVFGFITIMVISVSLVGKIINAGNYGKNATAPAAATAGTAPGAGAAYNAKISAAITAAVTEYRKTH